MASTSSTVFRPITTFSSDRINIPCRFFPNCKFGNTCKFIHDDAVTESTNKFNNNCNNNNDVSPALNPQAPVFVPTFIKQDYDSNDPPKSYADVVNANRQYHQQEQQEADEELNYQQHHTEESVLCPFLMKSGFCRSFETCPYAHGELCELCLKSCLDPLDSEQRKKHERECIAAHEKEMELAFSIQRSKEKTCGICFDIVWEKDGREQRFGILPNCSHCFCLECIRTWRQAKQFDNKIIRACPECRVCSDFVCPSSFWVDNKEEKDKLIDKYKNALSEKDCKYFKKGSGTCPFGNKCFYRHCLMDGKKVDVGEPARKRALNQLGQLETLSNFMFWNFLEHRVVQANLDDTFSFTETDSDESDFLEFFE